MNLPYPAIQTDVRGHCYVKISDVIEDFLAHGFLPLQPAIRQSHDWVTEISHSPQLVTSLQQAMTQHGQQPFYFVGLKNGKMIMNLNMLGLTEGRYGVKISPL